MLLPELKLFSHIFTSWICGTSSVSILTLCSLWTGFEVNLGHHNKIVSISTEDWLDTNNIHTDSCRKKKKKLHYLNDSFPASAWWCQPFLPALLVFVSAWLLCCSPSFSRNIQLISQFELFLFISRNKVIEIVFLFVLYLVVYPLRSKSWCCQSDSTLPALELEWKMRG